MHRLQDIYKSLGKEPNAKEYEIKALIQDFDKVARKQLERLRQAKRVRLVKRGGLIATFGLDSREAMMIGEEINSLVTIFDASVKRMTSIMVNYEDRKTDLT